MAARGPVSQCPLHSRNLVTLQQGQEMFIFVKYPRPYLGLTQFPIRCIPEVVPSGVKQPGIEADHSLHLMPRLRMSGAMSLLPPCALFGVGRHKFFSTLWAVI